MEIFDKNLTFCTTFHKLVYVNLYINKSVQKYSRSFEIFEKSEYRACGFEIMMIEYYQNNVRRDFDDH